MRSKARFYMAFQRLSLLDGCVAGEDLVLLESPSSAERRRRLEGPRARVQNFARAALPSPGTPSMPALVSSADGPPGNGPGVPIPRSPTFSRPFLPRRAWDYFRRHGFAAFLRKSATESLPLPGLLLQPLRQFGGASSRRAVERQRSQFEAGACAEIERLLGTPDGCLTMPVSDAPLVSIVVLTYNRREYTYRCLQSIAEHAGVPYELIIVDNASIDGTDALLSRVRSAVILRNTENVGFGNGCNQGAARARGRYLLLLKNDALLLPGCVAALVRTLDEDPRAAAAGAKLVWPHGALQEAGSILFADGSARAYGRGDDPSGPPYNYAREVLFCSAACLLLRTGAFRDAGGFDPAYAPAYYEDADLCLSLRARGHVVRYQPEAVAVHYEYTSGGASSAVKGMKRNRATFVSKWRRELDRTGTTRGGLLVRARDASPHPRVLVIDDRVPSGRAGSGFGRMLEMLRMIARLPVRATFVPLADATPVQPETSELQRAGVEVIFGQFSFRGLFRERKGMYDTIVVSRPHNLELVYGTVRQLFPRARIVYDAEALYSGRDELREQVLGTPMPERERRARREREFGILQLADHVLTVSALEREAIAREVPTLGDRISVWGCPATPVSTQTPFGNRADLLFVGSFPGPDSPNEDAVLHFIDASLHAIHQTLGCKIAVAGGPPPEAVRARAGASVDVLGFVDDLEPLYERYRLFVVPHRFSAGISLKVVEALRHGVPAVVSELTARQLGLWEGEGILVARDPNEFSDKVVRLYRDESLWERLRTAALDVVRRMCDPQELERALHRVIDPASMRRP